MRLARTTRWPPGVALMLSVGAAAYLPAAEPATSAAPPDTRLQQKVQQSQLGEPLGTYAERLTKSSRVSHEVRAPFDQRPLVALNINLTLARLQQALARNHQLTWQASANRPPRYTLLESRADKQARADAAAAAQRQARQEVLERLRHVRHLMTLSRDELTALARSGDTKARALLHPRGSAMNRLLLQLPDGIWKTFWSTGRARVPVAALSPDIQALARQAAGDAVAGSELGDRYRVADLVVPQGTLMLQFGGTLDRPTIWGSMRYGPHATDANLLYAEGFARQPPAERRQKIRQAPTRAPDDPHFRQKVTLKDQHRTGYSPPGERPPSARPMAEYLRQLAEQTDLPIVAECDYKPKDPTWLAKQWWLAGDIIEEPLPQALDLLCADFEYEWRFRNRVILLRPRRWYAEPGEQEYRYPKPQ